LNCWEAWQLAKTYRSKPSEVYNLSDPIAAYCFDRAVHLFGSHMQADLEAAGANAKKPAIANGKRQQVMSKWLGITPQYKSPGSVKASNEPKATDSTVSGRVAL
jgi:hypothetical protein